MVPFSSSVLRDARESHMEHTLILRLDDLPNGFGMTGSPKALTTMAWWQEVWVADAAWVIFSDRFIMSISILSHIRISAISSNAISSQESHVISLFPPLNCF